MCPTPEDNQDCGLATSLVYTMSNRELGNGLAVGLPILAASFFASPIVVALGGSPLLASTVSFGIGVGGSGHFMAKSYESLQDAQNKTLGYIYGDELNANQTTLDYASRQFNYDIVTLPVGFGLGGLILRTISVNAKAFIAGRTIFKAAQN